MTKVAKTSCVECMDSITIAKGMVLTRIACANCRQAKWERRVSVRMIQRLQRGLPAGTSLQPAR